MGKYSWTEGGTPGTWVYGEGKEIGFVGHAGPGKWFLTVRGKTVGRSFSSCGEAMKRAEEILTPEIFDIEPEGSEMKRSGMTKQSEMTTEEARAQGGETRKRLDVATVEEAYALGRQHRNEDLALSEVAKIDYGTLGILKGLDFARMTAEMATYVKLYQIKKSKEYRKAGMTWEEFCMNAGRSSRRVDEILADLNPVLRKISADSAEILGMPLSKIRYLGRSISAESAEIAENALIIGDQKIELLPENKDDIEAAIDCLKEEREKEIERHEKEVERLKRRVEIATEEETKSLTVERDALIKELTRLKVFDPEGKDISWSVQQIKAIKDACQTLVTLCNAFIMDDRLDGQMELLAEVEKWQNVARDSLRWLRQNWNERWNANFGEDI